MVLPDDFKRGEGKGSGRTVHHPRQEGLGSVAADAHDVSVLGEGSHGKDGAIAKRIKTRLIVVRSTTRDWDSK